MMQGLDAPSRGGGERVRPSWFRFGDGFLHLDAHDGPFLQRFDDLYRECAVGVPTPGARPLVRCVTEPGPDSLGVRVRFDDPEPLDQVGFALARLVDSGVQEVTPAAAGCRTIRCTTHPGVIAFRDETLIAEADSPWRSLAGSLAVHRVLRLQRNTLFFHAASVGIRGAGVLIFGEKGTGKTTLSLALAEAGHAFLGDELAAMRLQTLELLPFRRRLSIRPGPATPSAARALSDSRLPVTELPDGTRRTHTHAATLFPDAPPASPTPARVMVFLRSKGRRPAIEPFTPGRATLAHIAPIESVTWGTDRNRIALRVLALLGRLPCYYLDLGPLPETVAQLETLMEETWD